MERLGDHESAMLCISLVTTYPAVEKNKKSPGVSWNLVYAVCKSSELDYPKDSVSRIVQDFRIAAFLGNPSSPSSDVTTP